MFEVGIIFVVIDTRSFLQTLGGIFIHKNKYKELVWPINIKTSQL